MWGKCGNGYKERWPDKWEQQLAKTMAKNWCDATELMDHVISESKKMFKGTKHENDFLIYHDALASWWEKGSQEEMEKKGFKDRQIRCVGATNANNKCYKGKPVGDSPELSVGCDSHGFAYHKSSIIWHAAATSHLAPDDPIKFNTSTPKEMERTMERCWEVEPTSEMICADIHELPRVVDMIIEAEGRVLPECTLRHGRREARLDGKADGITKNKPRSSQRKATLKIRPFHKDIAELMRLMSKPQQEQIEIEEEVLTNIAAEIDMDGEEDDIDGEEDGMDDEEDQDV